MSYGLDTEIKPHIKEIKNILAKFPPESNSLEVQLESAAKHLKPYLYVIKTHFMQLEKVLKSESHGYKTLDNINLSSQIKNLMKLLEKIEEEHQNLFEDLANCIKDYQEATTVFVNENDEISNTQAAR